MLQAPAVRIKKLFFPPRKHEEQRQLMKTENAAVVEREPQAGEKPAFDESHVHYENHDEKRECENLLEHIRTMRTEVGDELSDNEFTRLMWESKPPRQDGFTFLSFCDRFVMCGVPKQRTEDWYEEKGWIKKEKIEIAKKIGEKYHFTFSQPPDSKNQSADNPRPHHHLQLSSPQETMVIIHPHFVKIRLYTIASHTTRVERPLQKCELLKDLGELYGSKDGSK
jgi:hypothetical protein